MKNTSIALAVALMVSPVVSNAITVDSDISDWINLDVNGEAEWTDTNKQVTVDPDEIYGGNTYAGDITGDQSPFPGRGGQKYDAEAFYSDFDSQTNTLYFAIVTGLSPDVYGSYFSGDVLFDVDGVVTGSGYGEDYYNYEYALTTFSNNETQNGSGIRGTQIDGAEAGNLYKVPYDNGGSYSIWNYGLFEKPLRNYSANTAYEYAHPTYAAPNDGTELVGSKTSSLLQTELSYTSSAVKGLGTYKNDNHYVIEASINLSKANKYADSGTGAHAAWEIFDALKNDRLNVHWNPTCNNDIIMAHVSYSDIPEPASLALMGLGVVGLIGFRRKKIL